MKWFAFNCIHTVLTNMIIGNLTVFPSMAIFLLELPRSNRSVCPRRLASLSGLSVMDPRIQMVIGSGQF